MSVPGPGLGEEETVSLRRSTEHRTAKRPRFGLRARVTLTFALGAALLSAAMSIITFGLTRENLLNQREEAAVAEATSNAGRLADSLQPAGSTVVECRPASEMEDDLTNLARPGGAQPVLKCNQRWYGATGLFDQDDIPASLVSMVEGGTSARLRTEYEGNPVVITGVPITALEGVDAFYYEGQSLAELESTLSGLAISLLGASALTTLAGGFIGFWASRRVVRPLLDVGRAADAIAGGRLDTRLPTGADPEVDRLATPFNHMASALQDRIERDARFASEVSHELRSPLMTMSASVEVLENMRDELPDRAQTALDLLSADMDRFQQLVEDLLEISRFDAGAITLHLEEVLVAEMVIQAVSVIGGGSVPVMYDEDVSDVIVRVDKRRFARVLANLLDNAAKYAGGATAVTIGRVGSTVQIAVEDNGPGIPAEDRDRIFHRFSRGTESGKRAPDSGVGLGLALVTEHVRLHGGDVWVEDARGEQHGARFVVDLPIVATPEPDETAAGTTTTEDVTVPT
jgi:signal transduction histidine kinase